MKNSHDGELFEQNDFGAGAASFGEYHTSSADDYLAKPASGLQKDFDDALKDDKFDGGGGSFTDAIAKFVSPLFGGDKQSVMPQQVECRHGYDPKYCPNGCGIVAS